MPLVRHWLRPRESCRVPPRAPRRVASPNHLRGGCPATARLAARLNQYAANTEPLFRFAAQILDENQAAKPQNKSKPCPSLTRPIPSLGSPRPSRFPSRYRTQQAVPFFVKPSRFYLHGSRSTRSEAAVFHLEPLRFYLFGLLEKILSGLRTIGVENGV